MVEHPMKACRHFTLILQTVVLLGGSCHRLAAAEQPPASAPTISQIASSYTGYAKITPEPVYVNTFLAMLCRGATKEEVEKERVTHGPHAHSTVVIHMNPIAASAFKAGTGAYPVGSVIVKQKGLLEYVDAARKTGPVAKHGVGGMVKREAGYDPAHGDWEYFYFDDVTKIESGRIASCVQCHDKAKATDHVFGHWNKPPPASFPRSEPSK